MTRVDQMQIIELMLILAQYRIKAEIQLSTFRDSKILLHLESITVPGLRLF